jgi:polyhydroxyalkanoate synthesis regulator phasin
MNIARDILFRVLAVFIASALGAIGAGSIFGIGAGVAAGIAGLMAVSVVLEKLAREFLDDGKLTQAEVNAVFDEASDEIDAKKKGQKNV